MFDRSTSRVGFLDVLRAVAAIAVAIEHYLNTREPAYLGYAAVYFDVGQFGVIVFLLVSGYIIPTSLERDASNGRFWVHRFFRLFPLYWAVLIAYAIHLLIVRPTGITQGEIGTWLVNLTMLQTFVRMPNVYVVFWTLGLELGFYAICSVLYALGLLRRTTLLVWLGQAGLFLGGCVLSLLLGRHLPGGWGFLLFTMFMGTAYRRCAAGELSERQLAAMLSTLAIVAAGLAYIGFGLFRRADHQLSWHCTLAVWIGAYGVFTIAYCFRDRKPPEWLCYLGRISYSIYLVHWSVLVMLPSRWSTPVYGSAYVGLTLLVSALTYRFIEQPAIALGRRLLPVREPRAPELPLRRAA